MLQESETVELKKSLNQLESSLKSVCSFLNHKGGKVFFGIGDKGNIVGLDVSEKSLRKVSQQIHSRIKPEPIAEIKKIKENGKDLIELTVFEGKNKPYFLNGIAFKRIGSEDRIIPPDELKKLILEQKEIKWDEEVCEEATLKDIDEGELKLFLREAKIQRGIDIGEDIPIKEALMRLKLLNNGKLTNAAILLFSKNPQHFFMQSEVKCIRFKGNDVTGPMIDMKVMPGTVINQLKKAEYFIFEHMPLAAWIENWKLQRQEKWLYPPKAIREALVNALVHRDYNSRSKVQVRLFDDRIEFWNPGSLPTGWSTEQLKQRHESIPRNPLMAKQFFSIKYVEEVGTGTNKIMQWCINWGLAEPEFEFTGTSLTVTFWKSRLTDKYLTELGLNQRQKKAITYIDEKGRVTTSEYAKLYSCSERTALGDLADLIKKEVLIRECKGKKTYYTFKYLRIPQKSRKNPANPANKYLKEALKKR